MPSNEPGRRSVLNWLLGIWGGGVLGAVLYPVARFLVPPVMRRDALIVGLTRFTPQGIRQTLADHPEMFTSPERPGQE